jgi:hypothetical protein
MTEPAAPDPLAPFRALADRYASEAAEQDRNVAALDIDEVRPVQWGIAAGWRHAEGLLRHTLNSRDNSRTTPDNPTASDDGTCSAPATETEPNNLVQVGWYCWRCRAINAQACRSDSVPVHVPAEWAGEMEAEIARREDEPDDTGLAEADIDRMMADGEPVQIVTPPDPASDDTRRRALARNAVGPALNAHGQWLPLSAREAVADAVLAVRNDELERLRAEVARLREGEEPVTDERVVPTPAQWIWWWNRATPAERLDWAARIQADGQLASTCFLENHVKRIPQARRADAALGRVRALAADMRTWCSPHGVAVDYADRIDQALNGPEETPS